MSRGSPIDIHGSSSQSHVEPKPYGSKPAPVYAVCGAGIGNRLPLIFSCARLAAIWGRELRVFWDGRVEYFDIKTNRLLHVPWPGGWEASFDYPLNLTPDYPRLVSYGGETQVNPQPADQAIVRGGWEFQHLPGEPDLKRLDRIRPNTARARLVEQALPFLEVILPKRSFYERADSFAREKAYPGRRWIGLNVRELHPNSRNSRRAVLNYALLRIPHCGYEGAFVSSDSREAVEEMMDTLGSRGIPAVTFPIAHDLEEDLASGAVIMQLLLLSRASEIVGNHCSTFHRVAWWWSRGQAKYTLL